MAQYGLDFETIDNRVFRLDDIQPFVYLGSHKYTSPQTVNFSFPEFAGIAEIMVTCDFNHSTRDGGTKTRFSTVSNISTGELELTITGALGSGNWMNISFSVFARFI